MVVIDDLDLFWIKTLMDEEKILYGKELYNRYRSGIRFKVYDTAVFSPCRKYRYALIRVLNKGGRRAIAFIGLNPSTADEVNNDPTVRRCISYAIREGYDIMYMLNIFGYRSTDPKALKEVDDPVGEENDKFIREVADMCEDVVCCWGTHGSYRDRGMEVLRMLWKSQNSDKVMNFGETKGGHPKHPLYLRKDEPLRFGGCAPPEKCDK